MRLFSLLLAGSVLFILTSAAAAQDAKKLIIGKWETTVKGPDNVEYKIESEFTEDGKLKVDVRGHKAVGTYTFLDDKNIETVITFKDQTIKHKQKVTVTQDKLELEDPKGQVSKFKRVK
jgi:uncharacterized protein (TIGR03066 family)